MRQSYRDLGVGWWHSRDMVGPEPQVSWVPWQNWFPEPAAWTKPASWLEGLGRKRSSERDHLEGPVLGILQLGVRIWHTFSKKVEMERYSSVKYSLHTGRVRPAKWETLEGQSFESSMGGARIACSLGVLPWGNTAFLRFSVNLLNRNMATYPSAKNQRTWCLWSV